MLFTIPACLTRNKSPHCKSFLRFPVFIFVLCLLVFSSFILLCVSHPHERCNTQIDKISWKFPKSEKILYTVNVARTLCRHKISYLSLVLSRLLQNSHSDVHQPSERVKPFDRPVFNTISSLEWRISVYALVTEKSQLQIETLYFLFLHVLIHQMNLDFPKSFSQLEEFRNVLTRIIIRLKEKSQVIIVSSVYFIATVLSQLTSEKRMSVEHFIFCLFKISMHVSIRSSCCCIIANILIHAHLDITEFNVFRER